jgi:hypothetical protein
MDVFWDANIVVKQSRSCEYLGMGEAERMPGEMLG